MFKSTVALVSISIVMSGSFVTAQDVRRDGEWWNSLAQTYKAGVMTGVFEGVLLGRDFAVWGIPTTGSANIDAPRKAADSYEQYAKRFLYYVNSNQLVDGLDAFYRDYRNRRILVNPAVWLVRWC